MKKVKRIFAGMAAAVMAFSTMSIGASADDMDYKPYSLYHTSQGGVTQQIIGDKVSPNIMFHVHTYGRLYIDGDSTAFNGTSLTIKGEVYDPSIYMGNNTYGTWVTVVSTTKTSSGSISPVYDTYSHAYTNTVARVVLNFTYGSQVNYEYAYGLIRAY